MRIRHLFVGLAMAFLAFSLHAQPVPYADELNEIQSVLKDGRVSTGILLLNELAEKLRDQQKSTIGSFFPDRFGGFSENVTLEPLDKLDNPQDHFGVLFTKRYQNKQNHIIDINVIYSDPAINEYANIIRNPKLVDKFENTAIIKVNQNYSALEKFSEEEHYCERNVLVAEDLLLNIVGTGIRDREVFNQLCQKIDFAKLSRYLKN